MESQNGTRSKLADLRKRAELGQLPAAKSLDAPISASSPSGKWKSRAGFSAGEMNGDYSAPDSEPSNSASDASSETPAATQSVSPAETTARNHEDQAAPTQSSPATSRAARFSANTSNASSSPANSLASSSAERIAGMAAKYAGRPAAESTAAKTTQQQARALEAPHQEGSEELESADESNLLPWSNENIPAGSGFTEEEWLQAEAAEPGGFVFEVLTGEERGLVHYPKEKMNVIHTAVLKRSLIVLVKHKHKTPFFNEACVTIHHKTEDMGIFTYKAIIARARLKTDSWIRGSVLHNWIVEDAPQKNRQQVSSQQAPRPSYTKPAPSPDSRAARFRSNS